MSTKDPVKKAAQQARWYQSHKATHQANIKAWKEARKDWWREFKKTLVCSRCPENYPACLDLHHVDPSQKEEAVSRLVERGNSMKRIQAELAKCIVLCANCHRKEHHTLVA